MKNNFFSNREFACQKFYHWETGDDFNWLRKEWYKFEQFLSNKDESKIFILSLAYIYNEFCIKAYSEEYNELDRTSILECSEKAINTNEITNLQNKIKPCLDKALDIMLDVYGNPEEISREFASITINFQLPYDDGIKYIYNLFEDKWEQKAFKPPPF